MNTQEKLSIVGRVLGYLNQDVQLPHRINGLALVYRLHVVDDTTVRIEGFLPKAEANCFVNAREEQNQNGVLWIAAGSVAYDDFEPAERFKLVKLNAHFRELNYNEFFFNENEAVFSRDIYGQMVDGVMADVEVA